MKNRNSEKRVVEWILRVGVFGTFLGHGLLAFYFIPAWIRLITVFGFSEQTTRLLLPIIGVTDIVVAFISLFYPMRIVLMWASLWGFLTALSRPIAGESVLGFIERSANWAAPLALLMLYGLPKKFSEFFKVK